MKITYLLTPILLLSLSCWWFSCPVACLQSELPSRLPLAPTARRLSLMPRALSNIHTMALMAHQRAVPPKHATPSMGGASHGLDLALKASLLDL